MWMSLKYQTGTVSRSKPKSSLSALSLNPCVENCQQDILFRMTVLNRHQSLGIFWKVLSTPYNNKLCQHLLAFSMPHKVRKLVVVGPKDLGKTSWSNIFHRDIPASYIASLTNKRQFSAAMINNETQLVLVDEWSASTMQSNLAKCILQGRWMVKHGLPKTVLNNSSFYFTTNNLPNFGKEEDDNMQFGIEIFTTTSLPQTLPGIDKWIYDHTMDCIVWIAGKINANCEHIDQHEL